MNLYLIPFVVVKLPFRLCPLLLLQLVVADVGVEVVQVAVTVRKESKKQNSSLNSKKIILVAYIYIQ